METTVTEWRIDTPQSLDLTGVRRLNVRVVAGNVDVVGSSEGAEEGAAHIEISRLEGPLQVSQDGDTLTIAHERLTWGGLLDWVGGRKASAIVSVSVPDGCSVELGVVSADAVVSGISAPTKVKSVTGSITLDGVRADVSSQTVSGDLETRELTGRLRFTTVSGDLTVVHSSSSQVTAETVSGDLTLDLDVPDDARLDLKSVSGDVTVRLPESAALQIEVKTMSGSLDCAFTGLGIERKPGKSSMRGQLGAGRGLLQAKTVSGDVTLLRRSSV
jgi:Putative adhesin